MDTLKTDSHRINKQVDIEYIVADWVEAVSTFNANHGRLTKCLTKGLAHSIGSKEHRYIGQCPVGQLVILINKLQDELVRLSQDVDTISHLPKDRKNYKKLARHTNVLNQLNRQAHHALVLSTLSSL